MLRRYALQDRTVDISCAHRQNESTVCTICESAAKIKDTLEGALGGSAVSMADEDDANTWNAAHRLLEMCKQPSDVTLKRTRRTGRQSSCSHLYFKLLYSIILFVLFSALQFEML